MRRAHASGLLPRSEGRTPPSVAEGPPNGPSERARGALRTELDHSLRTEFDFELPRGYVDANGTVHRTGTMRLATARDELIPLRDDRVRENPAYLTVVLLARVITRLGTVDEVHAGLVENLFAADLAFLQDLYRRINTEGQTQALAHCPDCGTEFGIDLSRGRLGES